MFDFLPESINPWIRISVYILIVIHLLAFIIYLIILVPSLFKKKETFEDQVKNLLKNNRSKKID